MTHLEDLEDAYLAETRAAEFAESGEASIPLADVMDGYGLPGRADAGGPSVT